MVNNLITHHEPQPIEPRHLHASQQQLLQLLPEGRREVGAGFDAAPQLRSVAQGGAPVGAHG